VRGVISIQFSIRQPASGVNVVDEQFICRIDIPYIAKSRNAMDLTEERLESHTQLMRSERL
jgi:hypothetical protein